VHTFRKHINCTGAEAATAAHHHLKHTHGHQVFIMPVGGLVSENRVQTIHAHNATTSVVALFSLALTLSIALTNGE
jgi:hypothetical protein